MGLKISKIFGVLVLALFAMQIGAVSATTITEWVVYDDPITWRPEVTSLAGSHTLITRMTNTTAEYYEATVNVTTNGTCWIAEFQVPDCYMGLDVWKWDGSAWVLMNGQTGYSLSVPYYWNFTDKIDGSTYTTSIPADWGSGDFIVTTPSAGSLYRVQLRVDEDAQLKIRVRYATEPFVGLDGVNDYIRFYSYASSIRTVITYVVGDHQEPGEVAGVLYFPDSRPLIYFHKPSNYLEQTVFFYLASPDYPKGTTVSLGEKHYYAFAYNSSNYAFYKNSNLASQGSISIPSTSNGYAVVGQYWDYNFLNGKISNIWVFNEFLSQSDVALVIGGSNSIPPAFKITPQSFNGSVFVDLSGNENHGTPYGNVQYKVNRVEGFQATEITTTEVNIVTTYDIVGFAVLILAVGLQIVFVKLRIPLFIMVTGMMGLVLNYYSLSSTIPYAPMPQMLLSLIHVLMIVHGAQMVKERI